MKKIIYILSLIFISTSVTAQLSSSFVLGPKPSASIYNWSVQRGFATYIVSNVGQVAITGRLSVVLKTTGGQVIGNINPTVLQPISFAPGNTVLQTTDILAGDAWLLNGASRESVLRSGKLAGGAYQLCITVNRVDVPTPIIPEQCRILLVQNAQLPFLIMPADRQELDVAKAQTAIIFRWTALSPLIESQGGANSTVYRIQVFEVLPNQQEVQALRSNQPMLDDEVIGTTQYIWRPQFAMALDTATKYIWTIQTLDRQGTPIDANGNAEGRSEPKVFIVTKNPLLYKNKKNRKK